MIYGSSMEPFGLGFQAQIMLPQVGTKGIASGNGSRRYAMSCLGSKNTHWLDCTEFSVHGSTYSCFKLPLVRNQ